MNTTRTLWMLALATALLAAPAATAQSGDAMEDEHMEDDAMMEDESNDSPGIGVVAALAGVAAVGAVMRRHR